jgi:hypothetical protein
MSTALERVIAEQQAKIDSQRKTIDHQVADMVRLNSSMQSLVSEVFVLLNNPSDPGVISSMRMELVRRGYCLQCEEVRPCICEEENYE